MKKISLLLIPTLFALACDDGKLTLEQVRLERFTSCNQIYEVLKRQYSTNSSTTDGQPMAAEDSGSSPGETNIQTAGVDEMDRSKADGDFVYTIEDSNLFVLRRTPVGSAAVIQKLPLPNGGASGLFVTENRVILLGSQWDYPVYTPSEPVTWYPSSYETVLTYFSRNSNGSLTEIGKRTVDGSLVAGRMTAGKLHLVLQSSLWYVAEADPSDIEKVIPLTKYGQTERKLASCNSIYHERTIAVGPNVPYINTLLCVVNASASAAEAEPHSSCVAEDRGSTVYASTENLFIASYGWQSDTPIHQFALSDAHYSGTALVPGEILNQFSMDEFGGYLRVATTTYGHASDGVVVMSSKADTVNQLQVLQVGEGDPALVGRIDNLAQGERIYSARFMGDRGFVVTFKKVDPLFAIDLSDPTNPVVRGELKIPGYSSYLHPMKEGYLLAVGKDAEAALESDDFAWYQGMAMSIFDVRNLNEPKLVQKIGIGSRGTDSEALHDHKAFRFDAESGLVVIPISLYEGGNGQWDYGTNTFNGFQIYSASVEKGFSLVGESNFADPICEYCWYDAQGRSFVRDGVISMIGGGEFVIRQTSTPAQDRARISLTP